MVAPLAFSAPSAGAQASTYEHSLALVAKRQEADDRIALPGARTILLTKGARTPRVIVLLHGLTDSPRQFEAFAYMLHADGNNVYVPRLPQHGMRNGDVTALSRLTADQMRGVSDSVVREARGLGDSVIVVGLSMGGTIGAYMVQQRVVTRAVLIAPAIEPGRIPSLLDRPLIGLADRLPTIWKRTHPDSGRPDREPGFNSKAVARIFDLGRAVLAQSERTPPATHNIVMLVNARDRTVKTSAAEALARNWMSHGAAVSMYELPDSLRLPHNIIDPLRGRVGGDVVLELLRELAYGRAPKELVARISDAGVRPRTGGNLREQQIDLDGDAASGRVPVMRMRSGAEAQLAP